MSPYTVSSPSVSIASSCSRSAGDCGRAKWKPCERLQPSASSASTCSAVSTPSAIGREAEAGGEAQDRVDDRVVLAVGGHAVDERLVDLDRVDRQQRLELAERRVADAEVVDREPHADAP